MAYDKNLTKIETDFIRMTGLFSNINAIETSWQSTKNSPQDFNELLAIYEVIHAKLEKLEQSLLEMEKSLNISPKILTSVQTFLKNLELFVAKSIKEKTHLPNLCFSQIVSTLYTISLFFGKAQQELNVAEDSALVTEIDLTNGNLSNLLKTGKTNCEPSDKNDSKQQQTTNTKYSASAEQISAEKLVFIKNLASKIRITENVKGAFQSSPSSLPTPPPKAAEPVQTSKPTAAAPAVLPEAKQSGENSQFLKVSVALLDELMALVGELVLVRGQLLLISTNANRPDLNAAV